MLINADFNQRATVAAQDYDWVASPQLGVERVRLDRVGGEQARATSIVRYSAGASFA
ncbi:cupin domain-containing protein, partial [Pseudomonas sp. EA_15y_Pfl1_P104]